MRAAVLCPGPSLPATWPARDGRDHEVVIAVNRASTFGCDWLAAYDEPTFQAYWRYARRGVLTSTPNAYLVNPECPSVVGLDSLDGHENAHDYSKHGALLLAVSLGATHVDLYGDDCAGERYSDGEGSPFINPMRWDRERWKDKAVLEWLESRGVVLSRVEVA